MSVESRDVRMSTIGSGDDKPASKAPWNGGALATRSGREPSVNGVADGVAVKTSRKCWADTRRAFPAGSLTVVGRRVEAGAECDPPGATSPDSPPKAAAMAVKSKFGSGGNAGESKSGSGNGAVEGSGNTGVVPAGPDGGGTFGRPNDAASNFASSAASGE